MNSITLLSTGSATLGVVELPQEAYDIKIYSGNYSSILKYKLIEYSAPIEYQITPYPIGLYEIAGWSDSLAEEQAKELVPPKDKQSIFFWDFENKFWNCKTALESFNSFLLSHGITNRVFIIKQI